MATLIKRIGFPGVFTLALLLSVCLAAITEDRGIIGALSTKRNDPPEFTDVSGFAVKDMGVRVGDVFDNPSPISQFLIAVPIRVPGGGKKLVFTIAGTSPTVGECVEYRTTFVANMGGGQHFDIVSSVKPGPCSQ